MSDSESIPSSSRVSSATSTSSTPRKSPKFLNKKPVSFSFSNITTSQGDLYDDPDFKKLLERGRIDFGNGVKIEITASDVITGTQLGKGQYGQVFACSLKSYPEKRLAYKSVRLDAEPKKKKLILAELKATKNVRDHPYAVQTYCHITFETNLWFVMELMDFSLHDLIAESNKLTGAAKKEVPEPVVRVVAHSAVECLSFLKSIRIIHRDVKPANILLRWRTGEVKIGDFGISGNLYNSMAKTEIFQFQYLAPERVDFNRPREDKRYTVKSDIWSLGVTCYELSTGRNPFNVQNKMFETLIRIQEFHPPELRHENGASLELSSFVSKCLEKETKKRPNYDQLKKDEFVQSFDPNSDHSALTHFCQLFPALVKQ